MKPQRIYTQSPSSIPKKKNKFHRFFTSVWGIIVIMSVVLGLTGFFALRDEIKTWTTTQHERFEEQHFLKGVFLPEEIFEVPNPTIMITLGAAYTKVYSIGQRFNEGNIIIIEIGEDESEKLEFRLRVIRNRLYVATVFKDIEKGEVIGIINFERWNLVNNNILDYKETVTSLEVLDKSRNVVFKMSYRNSNIIDISGYFVTSRYIYVVPKDSTKLMARYIKSRKEDALKEILQLKPSF